MSQTIISPLGRMRSPTFLSGVAILVVSFILYLSTIAPTLSWGINHIGVDGGELLTAASTMGVPHPPGYPTYTLLLKAFTTIVPVGDFAFRGNLLSAILMSLSVLMIYISTLRICRWMHPKARQVTILTSSLLSGAVFATAPIPWSLAVITEVYALNAMVAGSLVFITFHLVLSKYGIRNDSSSNNRSLALFGILLGLGLGNHLTILSIGIPMLFLIGLSLGWHKLFNPWFLIPLFVGLSVYIYIPLAAMHNPPINWGDADTPGGALWLITARAYQDYVLGVTISDIPNRILVWIDLMFSQFNVLGLCLGLLAIRPLGQKAPKLFLSLATTFVLISLYTITFYSVDFQVLMLPALLTFSVFVGIGFFWVVTSWISGELGNSGELSLKNYRQARSPNALLALILLTFLLIPGISITLNYDSNNLRNDSAAYERGKEILNSVPNGSVLLSLREYDVFPSWYIRYIERPNTDVAIIAVRLLQFDWYINNIRNRFPNRIPELDSSDVTSAMQEIVRHNKNRTDVYFTFVHAVPGGEYRLKSMGKVWKAVLE